MDRQLFRRCDRSSTIFELYVGISLSKKAEEEKSEIVSVLRSLPQLALDFQSACECGSIYGNKVQRGMRVDPEDAMLVGIAKVHRDHSDTKRQTL
jgi:tRNA(fMet)-specific endonuclease VapC